MYYFFVIQLWHFATSFEVTPYSLRSLTNRSFFPIKGLHKNIRSLLGIRIFPSPSELVTSSPLFCVGGASNFKIRYLPVSLELIMKKKLSWKYLLGDKIEVNVDISSIAIIFYFYPSQRKGWMVNFTRMLPALFLSFNMWSVMALRSRCLATSYVIR